MRARYKLLLTILDHKTPRVSDATAPLRKLTKKDIELHWTDTQETAFNNLKAQLANSETLQYYDVTNPVTLQVDASQKGLGAVLYQDKGPVTYASKAMNDTQRNYAQIEKEHPRLSLDAKDSTSISMVNMLSSRQTTNRLRQ